MSELQKRRAGRGRVRPPEDSAGNNKGRRGASHLSTAPIEDPIGAPPKTESNEVKAWWRRCAADWPQLNRRDRIQLLEFCRLKAEIAQWRAIIEEDGGVRQKTDSGRPILHPLLAPLRQAEKRADKMVYDFAATAGTREKARPAARPNTVSAADQSVLDRGKPD